MTEVAAGVLPAWLGYPAVFAFAAAFGWSWAADREARR